MDANLEDLFAETSSDNESFYGFTGEELGRSQEENDDDISVGEISSEDGEDDDETAEWPGVEVAEWTDVLQPVFIPPFNEETGPTQELGETSKEIDFFHLLFEKNIYGRLAEETNRYAQQIQTERGIDKSWQPTTPDEIQTFIGMRVYMSVVDLPELRMYWSEDKFFGNFGISEVMPRLRFEKLSQYFHANDRAGYNRQDPNRDKLYLIRPILDSVLAACLNTYRPHRDVAVDEAMIKFRGSLGFRQYMPAKPTKYGIKVWARADSQNGYVSEFEVYVGRPAGGQREIDLGRKVVCKLTEKIKGKNHHIYFDNYFNGIKLHEELLANNLYGCGTVRANAAGLPQAMKGKRGSIKLAPSESKIWQKGMVSAMLWQEKAKRKPVKILASNFDPSQPEMFVKRKQKDGRYKEVPCPVPVKAYNENMNGVDRSDQMRTAYSSARTSKR